MIAPQKPRLFRLITASKDQRAGGDAYAENPLSRPGAVPNRCHKRVVSIDGLLFSFVTMKPWKAEEENRPFL